MVSLDFITNIVEHVHNFKTQDFKIFGVKAFIYLVMFSIITSLNIEGGMGNNINVVVYTVITIIISLAMSLYRDFLAKGSEDWGPYLFNLTISLIYFGFILNAILNYSKNMKGGAFSQSRSVFNDFARLFGSSKYMMVVYMAVLVVLLNVISNLWLYYSCTADKTDSQMIESIFSTQIKIIILTVLGGFTMGWGYLTSRNK
jgi:hypothetical protein